MTRTEVAEPELRVDWIEPDELGDRRPGRLGMTILPGKHGASIRYPGLVYRRELDDDIAALVAAGARRLVLLVDDAELERWGDPRLVERAAARGLEVVRHPMPDGGTPSDMASMDDILRVVDDGRSAGDVAVACMGGIGRTGMVAACALARAGVDPEEAIGIVRARRHPEAVETAAQVAFVNEFAARGMPQSG